MIQQVRDVSQAGELLREMLPDLAQLHWSTVSGCWVVTNPHTEEEREFGFVCGVSLRQQVREFVQREAPSLFPSEESECPEPALTAT